MLRDMDLAALAPVRGSVAFWRGHYFAPVAFGPGFAGRRAAEWPCYGEGAGACQKEYSGVDTW
jgi:hypothetical protein